jgi:hypothetical protein
MEKETKIWRKVLKNIFQFHANIFLLYYQFQIFLLVYILLDSIVYSVLLVFSKQINNWKLNDKKRLYMRLYLKFLWGNLNTTY